MSVFLRFKRARVSFWQVLRLILRQSWPFLLLVLPAFIVFAPVLFFGRVFADGDALLILYPALHFLRQALLGGQSWLWAPGLLAGFPLAGGMVNMLFSPPTILLLRFLDTFTVYHWLTTTNFVLTAWFTYLFVRRLGLSRAPAVLAGLTVSWSAIYVSFGSSLLVTNAYWTLPLLFWVALRLAEQPLARRTWWLLGAVGAAVVAFNFYGAHPQWLAQNLIAVFAWALFLDIRSRRVGTASTGRWWLRSVTLWFCAMIVVGAVVAAPQLLLSALVSSLSSRQGGVGVSEAFSGGLTIVDLGGYLLPGLNVPRLTAQAGMLTVGALPFLLFLLSFAVPRQATVRFFRWLFGLALIASFQYSPLFLLLHKLPVLALFRVPSRWMYVGTFALAVLAAFGFEYLLSEAGRRELSSLSRRITVGVVVFAGITGVWNLGSIIFRERILEAAFRYFDTYLYPRTTQLSLEHYHNVISREFGVLWQSTTVAGREFTLGFIALVTAAILIYWYAHRSLSASRFATAAIALTALNLTVLAVGRFPVVASSALMSPPEVVQFLKAREQSAEPYRIFSVLPGFTVFSKLDTPYGYEPADNVRLHQELLAANLQLFYGLESLDGYENLMDRRSSRVIGFLGSDRATVGTGLAKEKLPLEEKLDLIMARLPVLSVFNVKYLISAYPLEHPQLTEVHRWEVTRHKIPLYLYENTGAQPRYYLTNNVTFVPPADEDGEWDRFISHVLGGKTSTLITCVSCSHQSSNSAQRFVPLSITRNQQYVFEVSLDEAGWFVFGQNFLPGWVATLDGKPIVIYRANFSLQAVVVPPGSHRIEFRFSPFPAWVSPGSP